MNAIVLGATGLVGTQIVAQLLDSGAHVVTIGRRASGVTHTNLVEHVVNLAAPESWASLVRGDVAFSALGTTLKAAGSKEAQRQVDYTYQLEFARAARANGVPSFVLISATGANADASVFYSRIKGELERDIAELRFPRWHFLRPGLLDGDRKEQRSGEKLSLALLRPLSRIIPAALKPVHVRIVARAAIAASKDEGSSVLSARDIFARGAA
jgi:uncharacterized protein YbjT (DUF2867 family)